ncbi:hypothetical protein BU24DRAFT_423988 [Aaosphaeria arxii CBS 175.79]|uniref:EthD domain-containing protein n=1 Tax=Aaosphaeria arxii CBS 175.79 TaxID=1450172 RepID=A0A6A5XP85_9PLEO|nr:uncharacterized protein BU24DRAFT_423988 [Aaosphaeria arxii CBS 175.79]KAF2015075.1 hypothetical protein BU24DRAFT_423988 [Aaosphaeria arxii CBS 175.79]
MVFRVYLLAVKAPSISLEEFKEQWDVHHINLLKEIAGDDYPQNHSHQYPKQAKGPADAKYDGIGFLEFKDKAAFLKLREITGTPENKAKLEAHDKTFLDMEKIQMYIVDDEE